MRNRLVAICLGSVMLLSGCKVLEKTGLWPPPSMRKDISQTESSYFPRFSVEKGIGFRMLEDGIDLRVDIDGDGEEDMSYKLVPVGYDGNTEVYIMAPLEGYIDRNKDGEYTEDEYFSLAGDVKYPKQEAGK